MATRKIVLAYGALLHDVGKVIYRGISEKGTHSELGARFIENEIAALNDCYAAQDGKSIVEQIRFHHAGEIAKAVNLADDSLAYITYFADNISAGMDRKNEGDEAGGQIFDKNVKLRKIFNILNGHRDDATIEHEDYNAIRERLKTGLAGVGVSAQDINSLINLLEATTSTVPSSTNLSELVDVSLYDHAKTTAGIAACIYDYLQEQGVENYKDTLFGKQAAAQYAAPMFLLYSCDMSGIQDFIYNISGAGALKQLRARSLYLELLLEHVVDELLERLELSRANLLYTGGGHAYLLLPNTNRTKSIIDSFSEELQEWLVSRYRTDLYVASAWEECSADDLMNKGDDKRRYASLYRNLSAKLSTAKATRYSASVLRRLNFEDMTGQSHERECRECHRSDLKIDDDDKCPLCASLGKLSRELAAKDVFVVVPDGRADALELPFDCCLAVFSREEYLSAKPRIVRVYTKNSWDMGIGLATHIWMGDYGAGVIGKEIAEYASETSTLEEGLGIQRLGVLRADVDNLGNAFMGGLPEDKISISRTATLSRSLSYFFKAKINEVMKAGEYRLQIIYSGGDDLFIVGNWSDVIHAAIDIHKALRAHTENDSLTISAGIGIFDEKYPIANMAAETGSLEDAAKGFRRVGDVVPSKNAVALWSKDHVYGWEEFVENVFPRKEAVRDAFRENEKGKAFVYKLIRLLRDADKADVSERQISVPRLAYLLARSFEDDEARASETSQRFYEWAMDAEERRYLTTALEWYVYETRERG